MMEIFYDIFYPLIYFMSLLTFVLTALGKHNESCALPRLHDAIIAVPTVLFGAFGTLCGMIIFGNLTDKKLFTVGVPVMLVLQLALVIYFIMS